MALIFVEVLDLRWRKVVETGPLWVSKMPL